MQIRHLLKPEQLHDEQVKWEARVKHLHDNYGASAKKVDEYINLHPGQTIPQIVYHLGLSRSSVESVTRRRLKAGTLIKRFQDGKNRYYPGNYVVPHQATTATMAVKPDYPEISRRIMEHLRKTPTKQTARQIAAATHINAELVSKNLYLLRTSGQIRQDQTSQPFSYTAVSEATVDLNTVPIVTLEPAAKLTNVDQIKALAKDYFWETDNNSLKSFVRWLEKGPESTTKEIT